MLGLGINKMWSGLKSADGYAVNSLSPKLAFDFDDEYYRTNGGQKSFSDAMTFARAGLATMVDSDGLIKWAPHNLLKYSEDLTNTWAGGGVTTTSDTLTSDVSTGFHYVQQGVSADAGTYTFSVKVKANGYNYAVIRLVNDNFSSDRYGIAISLIDGTFVDDTEVGSPVTSYSVSSEADGWYRISVSMNHSTGSFFASVSMNDDATPSWSAGLVSFTGDGTSGIYAKEMHLYRSDLGGMVNNPDRGDSYVPTTSSAVYLPRRGHHKYNGDQWVNKGILVESEARTNLWPWSTSINNSAWIKTSTTVSTGAADPSGGTSAETIVENSGSNSGAGFFDRNGQSAATSYTISALVKAAGRNIVYSRGSYVTSNDWLAAYFDLSAETATLQEGASNTGTNVSCGIESVGDGWYFIWHSFTTSASITTDYTWFGISNGASINPVNGIVSYTGDGVSGVSFWLPQIEVGLTPSSRIPTSGSTVTRAAETVTVPYANLPWPTPTYIGDELVTNGTFDTDTSGWSANNADVYVSSGELIVDDSANAGVNSMAYQTINVTQGSVYQITIQHRANQQHRLWVKSTTGIPTSGDLVSQVFVNSAATTDSFHFTATTNVATIGLLVDGTGTAYFDNISVREINPLSVSIAMQGEMDYADENVATQLWFVRWRIDVSNQIGLSLDTDGTDTGNIRFFQINNGVNDSIEQVNAYSPDLNIPLNIASRHGSTFINGALDGISLTENTTPTALPDLSTTDLNLAYDYMGTISEFRIWDRDIGDTGIAEATKPSLEPSLSLTFDGQPSSFTNTGLTL